MSWLLVASQEKIKFPGGYQVKKSKIPVYPHLEMIATEIDFKLRKSLLTFLSTVSVNKETFYFYSARKYHFLALYLLISCFSYPSCVHTSVVTYFFLEFCNWGTLFLVIHSGPLFISERLVHQTLAKSELWKVGFSIVTHCVIMRSLTAGHREELHHESESTFFR